MAVGEDIRDMTPATSPTPLWLLEMCDAPRQREAREQLTEPDLPANIARAVAYLQDAEPAIQGAGGDQHTYKTAAAVIDFGISEPQALEITLDHWNERCQPPWSPEELQRKIENAATYRTGAVGKNDPVAEFSVAPVNLQPETRQAESAQGLIPLPAETFTMGEIPKRRWLLGRTAIRGKLSVLIAPPGLGKSTYTIAAATAVVTGKELTGEKIHERTRAWLINNEDDLEEMRRRLSAVLVHAGLTLDDTRGLYMNSGEQHRLLVARRTGHGDTKSIRRSPTVDTVVANIKRLGIGLLIVDPFAETHEADENNNVEVREVAALYREIAQRAACAVILVHHTRKQPAGSSDGHVGNMDSGRGASSLTGVARVIQTLYGMSEKDAKRYGVPEVQRNRYVRLDDAKANLSLATDRPRWFRRVSVDVPSPGGETESVGVLEPATLTESIEDADTLVDLIAGMVAGGPRRLGDVIAELASSPMAAETNPDTLRIRVRRLAKRDAPFTVSKSGPGRPAVVAIKTRQNPSTENEQ